MNFSISVNAPCEQVFDVFADFKNAPARVDGIEKVEMVTGDDVGVGTKFRETRVMFGRESTEEMEVTEFEPGKKYTVEANSCCASRRRSISARKRSFRRRNVRILQE